MKKTILINLYGGPCSGKSTICAGLFYELKKRGYDCEMALEFAKEKVWDESYKILEDQIYIFGKQYHKIKRLYGKVDIVISDSPLLLNIWYDKSENKIFKELVLDRLQEFSHQDFFISRGEDYNENGRIHTLQETKQIDEGLKKLLEESKIDYTIFPQETAIMNIIKYLEL